MNLSEYNRNNLLSIRTLLESLSDEQFKEPIDVLSGSSIGAHVRHILEFYICLLREDKRITICYDERERNHKIETEREFASIVINNIILNLSGIKSDHRVILKADFSGDGCDEQKLESSIFRELAYCLEHSVHHEALIKVGIKSLQSEGVLVKDFGVAPSTIRHSRG